MNNQDRIMSSIEGILEKSDKKFEILFEMIKELAGSEERFNEIKQKVKKEHPDLFK